jgi:hypothetical protein
MSETVILGVSAKVVVAGAVGSAVGMVLGTGRWWERLVRGIVGAACAYVGHPVAAKLLLGFAGMVVDDKHLPTAVEMEPVAAFLIGVVGMVACQAAINAVTALRDKADDLVETSIDK